MNRQLFKDFQRSDILAEVIAPLTGKIKDLVDEMIFKRMDLSSKRKFGAYSIFADYDDNLKSGRYNALTEKELTLLDMTIHIICKQLHELDDKDDFIMRIECMLGNLTNKITSNLDKIRPGKEKVFNDELMPWISSKNSKMPSGIVIARIMSVLIMEGLFMTEDIIKNIQTLSVAGIRSLEFIDKLYIKEIRNKVHIENDDFKSAMAIAFQFHVVYSAFDETKNPHVKTIPKELEPIHKLFNDIMIELKETITGYDIMIEYFKQYMEKDMEQMNRKMNKNKFNQDDFE